MNIQKNKYIYHNYSNYYLGSKIKSILDDLVKCEYNIFKGINYNLEKLLINCNIKEILTLIYQAKQERKKEEEEIEDYVFEKISHVLPKDILINMHLNGFIKKNELIYKKIFEKYNKEEHSSIINFISKTKETKIIIYTFNDCYNFFKNVNINYINNDIIGKILKDNLILIQMNSLKSENELEIQLEDFYNNDKNKILFMCFNSYEGNFMHYAKSLIENKEKEYLKKNIKLKKIIIFSVRITRILNKGLVLLNEDNKETISFSSGYYQIFIDDLNEKNILYIDKLSKMKIEGLFKNIIKIDELISNRIVSSISYISYKFINSYKSLNNENYIDRIIEIIKKSKRLRNIINENLLKQIKFEKEEIFSIIKEDELYKNNEIKEEGILSVIIKRYTDLYTSKLDLLFFELEKWQFFSSLLSNETTQEMLSNIEEKEIILNENKINDNLFIKYILEVFLKSLKFEGDYCRKIRGNEVNIILGLKIIYSKFIYEKIIKIFKDKIKKEFIQNENDLRYSFNQDEKEKEKMIYINNKKKINFSIKYVINRDQELKQINDILNLVINSNNKIKNKLYELIKYDFFTLFAVSNNFDETNRKIIDNFDDSQKILNIMENIRYNIITKYINEDKETTIIERLGKDFIWFESYKEEIYLILKIFLKLSMKIKSFYKYLEDMINNKYFQFYPLSDNLENNVFVNEIFLIILNSILRVLTTKNEIYDSSESDLYELIHIYNEIIIDVLKIEARLFMKSKEIDNFQELLKIINGFYFNKFLSSENVKQIIKYFNDEII